MDYKALMTPRQFAKISGKSEYEIREKCELGIYPHEVKYSRDKRPFRKILVRETLAIIERECLKNAPFRPREEKPEGNKASAKMSKILKFA